jgi:SAM-dependent methyltransferase
MSEPAGVGPELFDDHYLHFYGDVLAARAEPEAELVARLLGLQGGEDVLDAPCGHGRIANLLAARGCRVVGVDNSPRFLALAEADARRRGVEAEYRLGDLRELAFEARFDAALNWFTSFGYFDAPTNRALLRAFRRALRPGGRLVLEQRNPALLRRAIDACGGTVAHVMDRGPDLLADRVTMEGDRSRTERFVVRDGRVRRLAFSLELLDGDALTTALRESGFAEVRLLDERGVPAGAESARLIAVARA